MLKIDATSGLQNARQKVSHALSSGNEKEYYVGSAEESYYKAIATYQQWENGNTSYPQEKGKERYRNAYLSEIKSAKERLKKIKAAKSGWNSIFNDRSI